MPSLTVENYVKTIDLIAGRDPTAGRRGAPASSPQALNVSPGTVTGMLKTLSEAEPRHLHPLRRGPAHRRRAGGWP